MSGAETEAEGDATDVEPLAITAAGEGDGADLPAELSALVLAATSDQSELPDLIGDPQLFGTWIGGGGGGRGGGGHPEGFGLPLWGMGGKGYFVRQGCAACFLKKPTTCGSWHACTKV